MFAWLIDNTIIYLLVFVWGYFSLKLFYHGFWGVLGAIFLVISYYDMSSKNNTFLIDAIYILGALDYKFFLREKALSNIQYGWQIGFAGIQQNFHEQWETLKQKLQTRRESINNNPNEEFNQNSSFDDELNKERERAKRAEEEARKAKQNERKAREEAERAKRSSQNNQNQSNTNELDPTKLKDAYQILGVAYGTPKDECKKAFRKLMAMYHPDKLAGFTGWRKEQMEKEAKIIGVAWETINSN